MLGLCIVVALAAMSGLAFERHIGSTWRQTSKTVAVFCAIAAGIDGLLTLVTHLARSIG